MLEHFLWIPAFEHTLRELDMKRYHWLRLLTQTPGNGSIKNKGTSVVNQLAQLAGGRFFNPHFFQF